MIQVLLVPTPLAPLVSRVLGLNCTAGRRVMSSFQGCATVYSLPLMVRTLEVLSVVPRASSWAWILPATSSLPSMASPKVQVIRLLSTLHSPALTAAPFESVYSRGLITSPREFPPSRLTKGSGRSMVKDWPGLGLALVASKSTFR